MSTELSQRAFLKSGALAVPALGGALDASDMAQIAMLDTRKPLIDHQDPQRIKWFNERVAGESLK